jgi:cation diffusion facilitator CzcD-associated flavoprotein CzcO
MPYHRFVIVGAGFSGLGAAIRLRREGIEDFVLLERADQLGGTWSVNTYPGCQCDVPAHLYSFSFAPKPDWTRTYASQAEIWEYLRRLSAEGGVDPHIRLNHDLRDARWDEPAGRWRLRTSAGELEAGVLIVGPGALSEPKRPRIEGIGSFRGAIFHSACWDHQQPLEGRRIAVIGTGASAIQFVPRIQPAAGRLHLFQRTPPWVIPHNDRPTRSWERVLYRLLPRAQRIPRLGAYLARELLVPILMRPRAGSLPERIGRRHLRTQVPDPDLRAKLTPGYRLGCKRTLISNDYYPSLMQPNVELVTDPITAITPRGIVTADGRERELDTIILATGFRPTEMPLARRIRGRNGLTLAERWAPGPEAYLGATVAGFPNMFLLVGPNTGLGHNSMVYMIESQLRYLIACIRHMERQGAATVEVREEVQRRYCQEVQDRLRGSVWTSGGCRSWYMDRHGRVAAIWPGFSWRFRWRASRFKPEEHLLGAQLSSGESSARIR